MERLTYSMVCDGLVGELANYKPPESLQVPGNLISHSSSAQSVGDDMNSDDESSPCSSADLDEAETIPDSLKEQSDRRTSVAVNSVFAGPDIKVCTLTLTAN